MGHENIEDYALIGDCHGCALISRRGSVDWLTLERFDSDPLLWKLLDYGKGAHLNVDLEGKWQWSRQYLPNTNILITTASNVESTVRFIDFMPVGRKKGSRPHDYTFLTALHAMVRIIEVDGNEVKINIHQNNSSWPDSKESSHVYIGNEILSETNDDENSYKIAEGRPLHVVVAKESHKNLSAHQLGSLLEVTRSFWEEWIAYSRYRGPHQKLISRSVLALKLLIHSPTGAIMAAPTTSLPERIGGERNWDYRFCWIRDATFTLYALSYLGYSGEADGFCAYLNHVICKCPGPLGVLFSLDGTCDVPEKLMESVEGFKGSSPVRVGNEAFMQRQLDTFGEFMDWAYVHKQLGGHLNGELLRKVEETANLVKDIWRDKDRGIWEVRGEPEDFTYSKIMCWVALDRAESLLQAPGRFQRDKEDIETFVREKCILNGRLKRSAQSPDLDASLLLTKIVAFPIDDGIYERTVIDIIKELSDGVFVKRYLSEDGLGGDEGEFLTCSFWAINALLFIGRESEARQMFEKLTAFFNDVGLLSEEYDVSSNHYLGNYPQALSHLAFIETASYFELYESGGKEALEGCHGDRVKRLHSTLHGPRAVWDYLIKTKNFRKLIPSRDSVLIWK